MEMTVYIQYRNLGREKLICIVCFYQEVRMCAYKFYFLYPDVRRNLPTFFMESFSFNVQKIRTL